MITYRIRKSPRREAGQSDVFAIGIPQHIAAFIPTDVKFFPELTKDGILFRAIRDEPIPMPENAPAWMNPEIEATLTDEERQRGLDDQ